MTRHSYKMLIPAVLLVFLLGLVALNTQSQSTTPDFVDYQASATQFNLDATATAASMQAVDQNVPLTATAIVARATEIAIAEIEAQNARRVNEIGGWALLFGMGVVVGIGLTILFLRSRGSKPKRP